MHELPLAVAGRRFALRPLLKVALLAAVLSVLAAAIAADPAPVIGYHYQDLAPDFTDAVHLSVVNPGLDGLTDYAASAQDACLSVGELYNTRFAVWRLPISLVGTEPCATSVNISASGVNGGWHGQVLVALNPVTGVPELGPAAGVSISYGSRTAWLGVDSVTDTLTLHNTTLAEFTFENATTAPVTVVSLSANPALLELLGPTYDRRKEREETIYQVISRGTFLPSREARTGGLAILQPAATKTFAVVAGPANGEKPWGSATTISVLPLVRYAGETYYLAGGLLVTYYSESQAHAAP